MSYIIYHNPRCSKSRETLELLRENKISPIIVEYLEHPFSEKEIKTLLKKLDMSATELIRKKESLIKEKKLDITTEEKAIEALSLYPKLVERPIVVKGNKAVLGRPPENVKKLF